MLRLLHAFLAAWLLIAMPLAQHGAQLHALGHAMDDGTPAEGCPDHSLYTPFAGTLGCGGALLPEAAPPAVRIDAPAAAQPSSAPRPAYRSRAPPAAPALR